MKIKSSTESLGGNKYTYSNALLGVQILPLHKAWCKVTNKSNGIYWSLHQNSLIHIHIKKSVYDKNMICPRRYTCLPIYTIFQQPQNLKITVFAILAKSNTCNNSNNVSNFKILIKRIKNNYQTIKSIEILTRISKTTHEFVRWHWSGCRNNRLEAFLFRFLGFHCGIVRRQSRAPDAERVKQYCENCSAS